MAASVGASSRDRTHRAAVAVGAGLGAGAPLAAEAGDLDAVAARDDEDGNRITLKAALEIATTSGLGLLAGEDVCAAAAADALRQPARRGRRRVEPRLGVRNGERVEEGEKRHRVLRPRDLLPTVAQEPVAPRQGLHELRGVLEARPEHEPDGRARGRGGQRFEGGQQRAGAKAPSRHLRDTAGGRGGVAHVGVAEGIDHQRREARPPRRLGERPPR